MLHLMASGYLTYRNGRLNDPGKKYLFICLLDKAATGQRLLTAAVKLQRRINTRTTLAIKKRGHDLKTLVKLIVNVETT